MLIIICSKKIPGTGYSAVIGMLTVIIVTIPFLHSDVSKIPTYYVITRMVYVVCMSVWSTIVFVITMPEKSKNSLDVSLQESLISAGKVSKYLRKVSEKTTQKNQFLNLYKPSFMFF